MCGIHSTVLSIVFFNIITYFFLFFFLFTFLSPNNSNSKFILANKSMFNRCFLKNNNNNEEMSILQSN